MKSTWVLRFNSDFEYELAEGPGYVVHPRLARLAWARASAMRLLCPAQSDPDAELILLAGRQQWSQSPGIEGVSSGWQPLNLSSLRRSTLTHYRPWGVTETTCAEAALLDPRLVLPAPQIVRRIQSRLFSLELEQAMGLALPGTCLISRMDELLELLPAGGDWVLKHPFGVAGRERLRLPGGRVALGAPARTWAERNLARHPLVLEPWVRRIRDWSVQLQLPPPGQGGPAVLGVLEQTVLGSGTWAGHRLGLFEPPVGLVDVALRVGAAAQAAGYFGPLGLDAFEYEQGSAIALRPLVEVNARYTMGMCALALAARGGSEPIWEWRQVERKSLQTPWPFEIWQVERRACGLDGDPRAIHFVCGDGPTEGSSAWGLFVWGKPA